MPLFFTWETESRVCSDLPMAPSKRETELNSILLIVPHPETSFFKDPLPAFP